MTHNDFERLKVLEQLESGELDFDQALGELIGAAKEDSSEAASEAPPTRKRWRLWWLLPFYFGVVAIGGGIVLANQGGGWWLLAVPLLLGGAVLTLLALASTRSPWLHVRIHNPERKWPRTIGFSIPIPFRFAAWAMRSFGTLIPNVDEQAVAELLMAFELGRMIDEPLNMELNGPNSATRVEIILG
jgi:hypothetical protein